MPDITEADLAALSALDTPTVCNALELVVPHRRAHGFNRHPLVCPSANAGPVVGFAKTAQIRCREPGPYDSEAQKKLRARYYEYVDAGPRPTLAVIQDIEKQEHGLGALWGEVNSNIHRALGCLGVITDGSVRDIDQLADGFFALAGSVMPSHAWVDYVAIDTEVEIAGMSVRPGDLIHADRHGFVVIPPEAASEIPAAADLVIRREAVILEATRKPDFSAADLQRAIATGKDIH